MLRLIYIVRKNPHLDFSVSLEWFLYLDNRYVQLMSPSNTDLHIIVKILSFACSIRLYCVVCFITLKQNKNQFFIIYIRYNKTKK